MRRGSRSNREPVIVVTGLPRSGTSLVMQALQAGGVEVLTDGQRKADEDNPRGYLELERVKALPRGDVEWLVDARGKAVKVIYALLRHLPADHRYQVVLVERDLQEVLDSQRSMLRRRNKNPDRQDDEILGRKYREGIDDAVRWIRSQENMDLLRVQYDRLVFEADSEMRRMADFLGRPLDLGAMARVPEPSLYRNRRRIR